MFLVVVGLVAALCGPVWSAEPPPPQAHGRLPYMAFAEISPDGRRVAYIRQFAGGRELVVITPGETRRSAFSTALSLNFPYAPPPKPKSLSWVSDESVVVEHTVTLPPEKGKPPEDFDGVFLYGRFEDPIFEQQQLWGYVVSPMGSGRGYPLLALADKHSLFLTEYDAPNEKKAVRLDVAPRPAGGVARAVLWYAGPDGRLRARSLMTGPPTPSLQIQVLDSAGGKNGWRTVRQTSSGAGGEIKGFTPLGFEDDANRLVGVIEGPGRRAAVADLDLTTGQIGPARVSVDGYDISGGVVDRFTGRIVGYVYADDEERIRWTDAGLAEMERQARALLPGKRAWARSWSRDRQSVLLSAEGPGDPGSIWIVRLANGEAVKVGDLYPAVPAASVAEMKPFRYTARDGLEISGYLTLPPSREPRNLPLILMPHGGPASRDTLGFDWWAQALAARGYAVLQPNFRGSSGFGAVFEEAGHGQWGALMQSDLSDALGAVVGKGIADPARVCIVGASYGGYAALAGATLTPDLYRCAISVAGVGDLPAIIRHSRDARGRESMATRYWSKAIGDPVADADRLLKVSPRYQAGAARAPILLLHGRDDTVVPLSQSTDMRDALKAAGKTVEFAELEAEDHHLRRETTRTQMLSLTFDFLARYNPAD
ncbi:S9 family peptidase [Caulobacter sp. NIBR1757]|uniref:S9 family peptidase n=1 Tax=Caulobacter sp. NIBR1757 TaxID=3016000 RepID=UPI0022F112E7|nr:S9 family peptidase [Caulobacter sp. NIBR1757]